MSTQEKRLGFLCSTLALGGMELNLLNLAGWMFERGWDIRLFGIEDAPFLNHHKSISAVAVRPYKKYFDIVGARALATDLKRNNIDVLILSSNRDINIAVLAKNYFMSSLKLIFLQQMQFGVVKRDITHTWQYRKLDAWIAPLEWLAEQTKSHTRIHHNKIHVIPLAIEMKKFSEFPQSNDEARQKLDLPLNCFIAGTVGRFDKGKNQELLVEAADILHRAGEEIHVLLLGENTRDERQDYESYLRAKVAQFGLEEFVHFRPFRRDVETAYHAMNVFVMTTPSESIGMVTIEAMASGIPVIAANGGGSPEILKYGEAGLLTEPRDAESLAALIKELRNTDSLATSLARKGQEHVLDSYNHGIQCRKTEELIDALYTE
jgi:D-inositol-3-phosphate glycosyltransferase